MKRLSPFLWIFLGLGLWTLAGKLALVHPLVLPTPVQVLNQVIEDCQSGALPFSLLYSFALIGMAFVPAVLLAFILALGSYYFKKVDALCEAFSALAHPLPGVAIFPLLLIWTGLGTHIIVLIVFHSVLWPLYINLRSGFKEVSPLWLNLGRNNELTKPQIFFHILIPGAYPSLLTGLKIGWARAWRAVIAGEMIFGTMGNGGGLGWYIFNKRIFMDTPGMYGGIILLMVIGLVMDRYIFQRLEKGQLQRRGQNG